jgi:hypothetical protein
MLGVIHPVGYLDLDSLSGRSSITFLEIPPKAAIPVVMELLRVESRELLITHLKPCLITRPPVTGHGTFV